MGRGLLALLQLIATPLYLYFLDIEGFGLIGFYNSLLALSALFDFGLSSGLQKELPALVARGKYKQMRNCAHTAELLYCALALLIALALYALTPLFVAKWHVSSSYSPAVLRRLIFYMGCAICFQWPFFLYFGGLIGLQKQARANVFLVLLHSMRFVGVLCVFKWFSRTVEGYFIWQMAVGLMQSAVFYCLFWHACGGQSKKRFCFSELRRIAGFTLSMSLIALTGLALSQMDKFILSRAVSLKEFGSYCLSGAYANGLYCIIIPLFSAFFPKFSEELSKGGTEIIFLYHRGCRWMATFLFPAAWTLALFAQDILAFWTQDTLLAARCALPATLLTLSVTLHGLVYIPYALQLASNWPMLTVYQNLFGLLFFVPLTYFLALKWQAPGAACGALAINILYFTVGVPLFHKKILRHELRRWVIEDILTPFLAALLPLLFLKLAFPLSSFPLPVQLALILSFATLSFLSAWRILSHKSTTNPIR